MQESPAELELIRKCVQHLEFLNFEVHVGLEVIPGHSNYGRSDIIARTGQTIYAIECKFINENNASRKRNKVCAQALEYASILKKKYPLYTVFACSS